MTPAIPAAGLTESVFDALREPVLVLDRDLVVRLANRSFYRVFKTLPEATIDRPLSRLGTGQWDIPALTARLARTVAEERAFDDFQVEHDFPGLGRRAMLLNGRRLVVGDGAERVLLAIEDVTERIEGERARERLAAELRRSNAELDQFAAIASHDLQEPLRMVVSYLQLLEEEHGPSLAAGAKEYMAFAVDGARRMQTLISDLLLYARIDKGDRPRETVSLSAAFDRSLDALGESIASAGARVERGDLPPALGEEWQFAQLFQNLVGNALKFRAAGRAPLVRVDARREAGSWVVRLADNGAGIPREHFETVFAPFERLHGAEIPGTGIGLALCRKIVERHGGRIWVDSSSGEGTTIAFSVPDQDPSHD